MNPKVFREFEKILSFREVGQSILEIGAVPTEESLLNLKPLANASKKIGINLDGGEHFKNNIGKSKSHTYSHFCPDYEIIIGNSNAMDCFSDNTFDTILCNAVLEHDKFFWKTISEIRRVAKNGALVVIGVPGFDLPGNIRLDPSDKNIKDLLLKLREEVRGDPVLPLHNFPGDYYRFSPQAFEQVIFDGMRDVEVYSILIPPRIIGIGYNVK